MHPYIYPATSGALSVPGDMDYLNPREPLFMLDRKFPEIFGLGRFTTIRI
jgi:hypothetical protein